MSSKNEPGFWRNIFKNLIDTILKSIGLASKPDPHKKQNGSGKKE